MTGGIGPTDVAAVIGPDRAVVGWTQVAERIWGYPTAEVLNRPAEFLLMPGREKNRAGPLSTSRAWSGQVELRLRDGRPRKMILRSSPLPVGDGEDDWHVWEVLPVEASDRSGLDTVALRTAFKRSSIGVAVWDFDLRCAWHNDALAKQDFLPDGPCLGRRVTELLPGPQAERLEAAMRTVITSGVPSLNRDWILPATAGSGDNFFCISLMRFDDADGHPVGVCLLGLDVSDSLNRQRLGLLIQAGTRIGSTLDIMKTAQELADASVPTLADYVTVDLSDAVMPGAEPLQRLGSTDVSVPAFYRAGVASIHRDLRESLWQRGTPVFVPPSSPFTSVLASLESHFEQVLDTSPGTWLDNDPDRARIIHQTGMHSLIIVPLQARGTVLGIAVFVRLGNRAAFAKADLELAEGLATRASLSLDNAHRYGRERTTALALQRDLLPHRLDSGGALEVASRYLPADTHGGVGGDWFDVIPMADGRVALVVGDVVGHGIGAAATMGRLRMVLNTLSNLELPPGEVLSRLDELVVGMAGGRSDAEPTSASVGATCVYVVYDPATQHCTMASAGHPPPAIVSPDGSVTFVDLPPGAPIGVGLRDFPTIETRLPEGSLIALYTDGLIETRGADIDHGLARLRAALALPAASLRELCTKVTDVMALEGESDDDIALLLARTLTPTPDTP